MISVAITVVRSENPEEDRLNNCNVDFSKIIRSNSGEKEDYMDFSDYSKDEQDYIIRSLEAIVKRYKKPTAEEIKETFKINTKNEKHI